LDKNKIKKKGIHTVEKKRIRNVVVRRMTRGKEIKKRIWIRR
jgi:hypothetical protein